ncbi:MAG: GtrA family protein [Nocardioidaceae bacterium]
MGRRGRRLLVEASRFLAVGGLATLVAFVLFNLLVHGYWVFDHPVLNDHPLSAYVIANFVGMVISYRGTRSWAFKHRETSHADGGRTAFVLINIVTMAFPIACLWFSRNVLGHNDPFWDNLSANVVGLGLGTAARFYLFRTWVFRHPELAGSRLDVTSPTDRSTSDRAPRSAP